MILTHEVLLLSSDRLALIFFLISRGSGSGAIIIFST